MTVPAVAARRPPALVRLAELIDREPALVLPVWIAVYFAVLWGPAHRPFWYDELLTYYVSMSPTFEHFAGNILHVDLNPPLSYLFERSSIALFGDTPFVARLPYLFGFLGASLIAFRLITRRLGGGLGLASLGLMWSFSLTAFAVEARTYGLLLLFLAIATLCWLNAIEVNHWSKWHTGLSAGIAAMLLTHCFAPVIAAAIGVGELIRAIVSKRIDKRMWAALLAPLLLVPIYIPLFRNAQHWTLPKAYAVTASTIPLFYLRILLPVLPAIALMLVLWFVTRKTPAISVRDFAAPHETAFALAAMFLPVVIIGYCYSSHMGFFARYGIGAALGGGLILTAFLAKITKHNANISVAAAFAILILFAYRKADTPLLRKQFETDSTAYRTLDPDLPFVTACGLTFLEMDHREPSEFTRRMFYLTDWDSAVKYIDATVFESVPLIQQWFPIRANVSPYREFVKTHNRFVVLASPDCPLEWLLLKLKDDGAQIRLLQDTKIGYRDRNLYEVTYSGR